MTGFDVESAKEQGTVSTLIDAALTFARGRRKSGVLLLGAAASASRIPGVGTAASLVVRLVRRFR